MWNLLAGDLDFEQGTPGVAKLQELAMVGLYLHCIVECVAYPLASPFTLRWQCLSAEFSLVK